MIRSTTLLSLMLLCLSLLARSQDYNFLTIVIDQPGQSVERVIYYPAGSEFEVMDNNVLVDLKEKKSAYTFLGEDIQLVVFPSYSKAPDRISVKAKRLRVFVTAQAAFEAGFAKEWDYGPSDEYKEAATEAKPADKHSLSSEKVLIESELNPGTYNLTFTLSNGVTFEYIDGKTSASYQGEQLYVKHKYLIYSPIGVLKLSFNPQSGVVWWIFEEGKAE